jgi:hypothetical protein
MTNHRGLFYLLLIIMSYLDGPVSSQFLTTYGLGHETSYPQWQL